MAHGLARGRQRSWNVGVATAAAAKAAPVFVKLGLRDPGRKLVPEYRIFRLESVTRLTAFGAYCLFAWHPSEGRL
jgi:hypothetical protein